MTKKRKKQKTSPKVEKQSNIKKITCVDCPRDVSMIVKQEDCKQCEYHSQGYCKYVLPAQFISIVSSGTPMKFNRTFFQSISTDLADTTRNYYLLTDIMQPVRNIREYPNYSRIKARFLSGEFKTQETKTEDRVVSSVSHPVLSLVESEDTEDPVIVLSGRKYVVASNGKDAGIKGNWEIIYYLYDTYSLDGFADIKINDRWYKVRMSPIEKSKEDYVLAKQNNKLIIGRLQESQRRIEK